MLSRNPIGQRAVEMLVQQDPKRSADGALGLLLGHVRASSAAVFLVRQRELVLFVSRGIDQGDLDRARRAWARIQKRLPAHEPQVEDVTALFPLQDGEQLLGALYIGSAHRVSVGQDILEAIVPILLAALKAAENPMAQSPVDAYLENTPAEEIEREQLMLLLSKNEWNIARVARIQGVSRVTIYHRLVKYGLSRKRPQKPPPSPQERR
jgi:transcriptional regulator with GAF, ATPase, and Fis domain